MSTIAELIEERVVEGTYAVARKERRRTKNGAPYLALELVDPSGRIDARVWKDVELLDARFNEGDAVRLLGRVERFRDRLQVDVRSLEAADGVDPAALVPAMRRDADELEGFLDFLAAELSHPGLRAACGRLLSDPRMRKLLRRLPASETHHSYAGGLLEHTVGVATLAPRDSAAARAPAPRPAAGGGAAPRRRPHARAAAGAGVPADRRGPAARPRPPRPAARRGAARPELDTNVRAELLHAIACHHDARAARTAEAAVLYHANQLDAVAATRPVE